MPRYQKNNRYQLGEYFLGQRAGSAAWYRCWMEGRALKRASLLTDDFEEAKRLFNAWWADNYRLAAEDKPPAQVKLTAVLEDYYNQHAVKLRSAQTCKIFCRYWAEWWGDASVADVRSVEKQEAFQASLAARGLNPTSVARCLEIGRAAIRRAWKRGAISACPYVNIPPIGETQPKGRPLSVEDIGKMLRGTDEPHVQLFILLMLATGARPEALFQLTWAQIDFQDGLIRLNPDGRKQTSKRRPVVKLPDTLRALLLPRAGTGNLITFRGQPIRKVDSGWHKMVKRAGLVGNVTPYSMRHTVARWMRQHGVQPWEVAAQLGHSMPQYTMSEKYASHSPDYLANAVKALDQLLALVVPAAGRLLASSENQLVGAKG